MIDELLQPWMFVMYTVNCFRKESVSDQVMKCSFLHFIIAINTDRSGCGGSGGSGYGSKWC